jgi:DNA gyrase subunit A
VKGIELNKNDYVVCAQAIPEDTKEILTISEKGYIKRTLFKEFSVTSRGTKGSKIQRLNNDDYLICFNTLNHETQTIVVSSTAQIKINLNEVNLLTKGALGTKSMKLSDSKVIGLLVF